MLGAITVAVSKFPSNEILNHLRNFSAPTSIAELKTMEVMGRYKPANLNGKFNDQNPQKMIME
jgi:hypothetical protein